MLRLISIFSPRWRRLAGIWLVLLGGNLVFAAGAAGSREYQLKAVFLFNFAQFAQWPASAFENAESPIVIGILGDDPFEGALDEAVGGEKVRGRAIVIRRFRRAEEARAAHILFVCTSERSDIDRVLAGLSARPILTVSDIPGFARRGGTIAFYFDGPKLRFEINPVEAQRNGLQLSSQLLNLARIVPGGGSAAVN